jgi:hypothetical protein
MRPWYNLLETKSPDKVGGTTKEIVKRQGLLSKEAIQKT